MSKTTLFVSAIALSAVLSCGSEGKERTNDYEDRDTTLGFMSPRSGYYTGTIGLIDNISPTCLTDTSRFCCPASISASVDIGARGTDMNGQNAHYSINGANVAEVAKGLDWSAQGNVVYDDCQGKAQYTSNFINVLHGSARYIHGYVLTLNCPASPAPVKAILGCTYAGTILFQDN